MSDYGWDEEKAHKNKEKHGVEFKEVVEVFRESPVVYFGEDTSEEYPERRFCAAGISKKQRLLFTIFEDLEEEDYVHIIHAKEFERGHLKHFKEQNDRAELTTLVQFSPRKGSRRR